MNFLVALFLVFILFLVTRHSSEKKSYDSKRRAQISKRTKRKDDPTRRADGTPRFPYEADMEYWH